MSVNCVFVSYKEQEPDSFKISATPLRHHTTYGA